VRRGEIFSDVRQSDAIENGANHEFHIVNDQRTVDRDGQRLLPLIELPAIDLVTPVAEVDASMLNQFARRLGPWA
jgi:hypothetical protein